MKILIVGLGIQGNKRKKLLNKNFFFATVDNKNKKADYKIQFSFYLYSRFRKNKNFKLLH